VLERRETQNIGSKNGWKMSVRYSRKAGIPSAGKEVGLPNACEGGRNVIQLKEKIRRFSRKENLVPSHATTGTGGKTPESVKKRENGKIQENGGSLIKKAGGGCKFFGKEGSESFVGGGGDQRFQRGGGSRGLRWKGFLFFIGGGGKGRCRTTGGEGEVGTGRNLPDRRGKRVSLRKKGKYPLGLRSVGLNVKRNWGWLEKGKKEEPAAKELEGDRKRLIFGREGRRTTTTEGEGREREN